MTFIIISVILFILLLIVIRDDLKTRDLVLDIEDDYKNLHEAITYLAKYYDSMLQKMQELDTMGGYETQDDFGVFFKYVKQSLLQIKNIFKNRE